MPIVSTDIKYKFSGGASNSDPSASLGGTISSVDAATYFDDVSSAEASAGDVEYRCLYIKNTHATLTMLGSKVFIQTNTPSASSSAAIGLGTSAINGTEQTVADESTAPSGVTFSEPSSFASGLSIGDLAPGDTKAIWVRRTIDAGAAVASDNFTLRTQCDTNP